MHTSWEENYERGYEWWLMVEAKKVHVISNMGLVARNLSSGFPTKRVSNQLPQLQRLARKLKLHL